MNLAVHSYGCRIFEFHDSLLEVPSSISVCKLRFLDFSLFLVDGVFSSVVWSVMLKSLNYKGHPISLYRISTATKLRYYCGEKNVREKRRKTRSAKKRENRVGYVKKKYIYICGCVCSSVQCFF
jgi:hypothetical protein